MDQQLDGVKISVNKDSGEKSSEDVAIKKKFSAKKTEAAANVKRPPKESKKGMFPFFVVALIVVLLAGGGVYFWQQKVGETNAQKIQEEAKSARLDFEQRLNNLKDTLTGVEKEKEELRGANEQLKDTEALLVQAKIDYANDELGLNFSYPAILGQLDTTSAGGVKGQSFKGVFSKTDKLSFGGVSKDYISSTTASTSIIIQLTAGYAEKDKKFYLQTNGSVATTDFEIKPFKVIDAENNKVLLVDKNSFLPAKNGTTIDIGENIGAIVNLKNKTFVGLVFVNQDLGVMPMSEFEAMLKTIGVK